MTIRHFINPTISLLFATIFFAACNGQTNKKHDLPMQTINDKIEHGVIIDTGATLQTRFKTPSGFERKPMEEHSFANYLRNLPLKPTGSKVKYYNGEAKDKIVYDAVVDMEISNKDLQQCADAIMRLRGEFFYSHKEYDKISFTLTNGFRVDYSEWMKGKRVAVNGNNTSWVNSAEPSNNYSDFREYMDFVFMYAGTLSLSKSLLSKDLHEITIGDVFIKGGSPGHAVIVVDVAENNAGEKVFMLAQSYMPAQETHILKNPNDQELSPWYKSDFEGSLRTPEWTFTTNQLKTW